MSRLSLCIWKRLGDIWEQSFWQEAPGLVIVPSPAFADFVRTSLTQHKLSSLWSVVTLSEFISNQLSGQWGRDSYEQKYLGKSGLKLLLARAFRQRYPQSSLETFENSFQEFTDLRTFSIDTFHLQQLFDELPPATREILGTFQALLLAMGKVDEAQSYFEIDLTQLKTKAPTIAVWGFSLMSGVQIDFLKRLSDQRTVKIILSAHTFNQGKSSDWFHWLQVDKMAPEETSGPQLAAPLIKALTASEGLMPEIIAKKHQVQNLQALVVPSMQLTVEQLLFFQAPYGEQKIPLDLFAEAHRSWRETLEVWLASTGVVGLEALVQQQVERCYSQFLLPELKLWVLFSEQWKNYSELSQDLPQFSYFELGLFTELLQLDAPRVSVIPTSAQTWPLAPQSLLQRLAHSTVPQGPWMLVLNYQWLPATSGEKVFAPEFEAKLLALGPLPRARLPLLDLQALCLELLQQPFAQLIFSPEIEHRDLAWSQFLGQLKLDMQGHEIAATQIKNILPSGLRFSGQSLSLSAFNTFIQCPRKYYQTFLEQWSGYLELEHEMGPAEKGNLWHLLMQRALSDFKQQKNWRQHWPANFEKWLVANKPKLAPIEREALFFETQENIVALMERLEVLLERLPGELYFEHPQKFQIDQINLHGRSDFKIVGEHGIYILDFKKTKGSLPSQQEFLAFQAPQLWGYGLAEWQNPSREKPILGLGHIVLERQEFPFQLFGDWPGQKAIEVDIPAKLEEFQRFAQDQIQQILAEVNFIPRPIGPKICRYCDYQKYCPRGGLDEDSE